jgi:hypothetical protein
MHKVIHSFCGQLKKRCYDDWLEVISAMWFNKRAEHYAAAFLACRNAACELKLRGLLRVPTEG